MGIWKMNREVDKFNKHPYHGTNINKLEEKDENRVLWAYKS